MDKTKQQRRKIVAMARRTRDEVGRAAGVCAFLCCSPASLALAEASKDSEPASSGLGYGGAYLFGLAAGLLMFAIRYAIDARKAHLAAYGK
jgi:hypothetical protein